MRPSISTAHSPAASPQPPHTISAFQRRKLPLAGWFSAASALSLSCVKEASCRQTVKAPSRGSEHSAVGKGGNTIETRVL